MWRSRWAAIGAAVAVSLGAGGIVIAHAATTGASSYVPMTPCRLLDTRAGAGIGGRSIPLDAGETYTVGVHGTSGNCTIPVSATGVSANVTTLDGTSTSFLTIWPPGTDRPNTSTNNWTRGQPPTPNKVDSKISADGKISLYNDSGKVNVIVDVVGYYEPAGTGNAPQGSPGPVGPIGPAGPAGAPGANAPTVIPSGTTVRGGIGHNLWASTAGTGFGFTFMMPTPPGVPVSNVWFADGPLSNPGGDNGLCTGNQIEPTAPPGYLCLYLSVQQNVVDLSINEVDPLATGSFAIFWRSVAVGDMWVYASWAYTAP